MDAKPKTMPNPNQIVRQINDLITRLVQISLSDDQRFALQKQSRDNVTNVTFSGAEHVSFILKNQSYSETYKHLINKRAYNLKMVDGALIQIMYRYVGSILQQHRLVFLPAPHLEEYQNSPENYEDDVLYADVVARNVVPVPIRFDYDCREDRNRELEHPKSHLTLGQYQQCRIPVTAPITPFRFFDFILRNFYETPGRQFSSELVPTSTAFTESILPLERNVIHIAIPI